MHIVAVFILLMLKNLIFVSELILIWVSSSIICTEFFKLNVSIFVWFPI
jgi:hypothetical protein